MAKHSRRPVRRKPIGIDPMFNIPDGVDELVYSEDLSIASQEKLDDQEDLYGEVVVTETPVVVTPAPKPTPLPTDTSGLPPAPKILGIIKQTIRTLPNGTEVVDVVFKVEDIKGADDYRFRVTKT